MLGGVSIPLFKMAQKLRIKKLNVSYSILNKKIDFYGCNLKRKGI